VDVVEAVEVSGLDFGDAASVDGSCWNKSFCNEVLQIIAGLGVKVVVVDAAFAARRGREYGAGKLVFHDPPFGAAGDRV
jgi:hypothetical protein